MTKIVICGANQSGKTCYLYGMLSRLLPVTGGFAIYSRPDEFIDLREGISRLENTGSPLAKRLPMPDTAMSRYQFELRYKSKSVENISWIDYPGALLESEHEMLFSELKDADCLLVCVDGDLASCGGDWGAPDSDQIVNDLCFSAGGLALLKALNAAISANNRLPPVCVMVTKYDMVPQALRNKDFFADGFMEGDTVKDGILRRAFPLLFGENGGAPVTVLGVSLGANFGNGGPLDPSNVEKPILFAVYWKLRRDYNILIDTLNNSIDDYNAQVNSFHNMGFRKLFAKTPKPPFTKAERAAYQSTLDKLELDIKNLEPLVATLPHYKDGMRYSVKEFQV